MHMRTLTLIVIAALAGALVGCGDSHTIHGPGDKKLDVTIPSEVEVRQGAGQSVTIGLDRKNFAGPIEVTLGNLPEGTSLDEQTKTVETDQAVFMLSADSDADLVRGHAVSVDIKAPHGMTYQDHIPLTVTLP